MRRTEPAGNERWALPRAEGVEWLDAGLGTAADAAANLAEMWRLNRWLGGLSALTRHLYPRLERSPAPATVLDLGAGAGDVAAAVAGWARRRGLTVRVIAADWAARNLSAARANRACGPSLSLLRADAVRLPLAARSVDYVISTLLLHHFAPAAAVELLRSAFEHARRGLIMSDLVRGRLPLWAFRLAQPVVARHPFTRHDGALSIRRAYTPAEALALARAAGLPNPRVHAHWPWRLTLVADRDAGD